MKALLVIDMQNGCVGENHADFFQYDNELIMKNVNEAISHNQDSVIIYIRNLMKKNFINKFAPVQILDGTPEAKLAEELDVVSDHIFDKYTGDAFSNEKLAAFLKEQNITEVEVIGVDGGGCVALTALGAIKNGYKVIVNTKAIGTNPPFEKNKEKLFCKLKSKGAVFI